MARSEGFEPPTLGIEIRCSIQLSYERVPVRIAETAGEFYGEIRNRGAGGDPGRYRPLSSGSSDCWKARRKRRRCRADNRGRNCADS